MSALEALPREIRQMINKDLLVIDGGLQLVPTDIFNPTSTTSTQTYDKLLHCQHPQAGSHGHKFYIELRTEEQRSTSSNARESYTRMRSTSRNLMAETTKDFFLYNDFNISDLHGNDLWPHRTWKELEISVSHLMLHSTTLTMCAYREDYPCAALMIQFKTNKLCSSRRKPCSAKALATRCLSRRPPRSPLAFLYACPDFASPVDHLALDIAAMITFERSISALPRALWDNLPDPGKLIQCFIPYRISRHW